MELTLTIAIIVITSIISLYAMNQQQVLYKFTMNPYMVTNRGQYYRMITSGFIHKDHMHLIFNMFTLYFFGTKCEIIFRMVLGNMGGVYYILLYLLAIVVSDVTTLFKNRNNPGYNSLGASGAVSAVLFATILFDPVGDICFYAVLCFPGFILGAVYLIYSYISGKRSGDGINHDAHLFGALFGVLFCIVLYPNSMKIFIEQLSQWSFLN